MSTFFGRTHEELGELLSGNAARYLRKVATDAHVRGGFEGLALFAMNMMRHAGVILKDSGAPENETDALFLASDAFFYVGQNAPPEVADILARTTALLAGEDPAFLERVGHNPEFQKSYAFVEAELGLGRGAEHVFLIIAVAVLTTGSVVLHAQDEKDYMNAVGNFWEDVWADFLVVKPPPPAWSVS